MFRKKPANPNIYDIYVTGGGGFDIATIKGIRLKHQLEAIQKLVESINDRYPGTISCSVLTRKAHID